MEKLENKRTNQKKSKKNIFIIIGVSLVAIFALGFGYLYYLLNKPTDIKIDESKLGINEETVEKFSSTEIKNIALFGVDAPNGVNGRTDAIMILSIDEKNKKLKLSSIMRDSYVEIEGYGKDKINHAYAFGGPELAINTINTNFNLDIDSFVSVNFSSLPKIIDYLGGVTINITPAEIKYIPGVNSSGTQVLNGAEALAYSRIRYDGGDQMRTQRQRNVLNSLFNKLINLSPTKYPKLLDKLLPLVSTNISSTEFLELGTDILKIKPKKLYEARFPCDSHRRGELIKGISYQTFDIRRESDELHKFIFN